MTFKVIIDHEEQKKYIAPIIEKLGSQIPAPGQGVIFAQFDDAGEVVAFQILQTGLFAEGLWARDGSAQIRTLGNMVIKHLENSGLKGRTLLTITRNDEAGERIGRFVKYMKFTELGKVYQREI